MINLFLFISYVFLFCNDPFSIVENENHCDFVKLREMLLRINMEDLRETTQTKHYEVYRRTRLEEMGFGDVVDTAKASTFQVNCSQFINRISKKKISSTLP